MSREQTLGVWGIGAIGTVVAYHLGTNSRHQLYYFNRSKRSALHLVLPDQQTITKPIVCRPIPDVRSSDVRSPLTSNETSKLDWLFVCLKAHQITDAIPSIRPLIDLDTQIVVIRNGLNFQEDWIAAGLADQVLPVLIDCPTQLKTEAYYEQLQIARLTAPDSRAGRKLVRLIRATELELTLTTDFKTASWLKLTESAALGAVTCLTGAGCWVFEDARILAFYQSLLEEIVKVALADGALIPSDYIANLLVKVKQYPPHKTSSMLADRKAGKSIELSAKNGIISELARKYELTTPLNDLVCTLLSVVNRGR